MIKFTMNWDKAIEAIVWLARRRPGIGHFHIAKILYFADKAHLLKYGRPIIGDSYIAMEHGPVPSGVCDLLTGNSFLDPDLLDKMAKAARTDRDRIPQVTALRAPDPAVFSGSDLRCLEDAFAKYVDMPLGELRRLTHDERAWREAPTNTAMDPALLVDEDDPQRDELLEEIREKAAYATA